MFPTSMDRLLLEKIGVEEKEAGSALQTVWFFGLSGVGKSTLMNQLSKNPLFHLPTRLTTREPKAGDFLEELEYISAENILKKEKLKELFICMIRDPTEEKLSYSGYSTDALDKTKINLLFASVFNLEQVKQRGGLRLVVNADWREGLRLRGGRTEKQRILLNEKVEHHFMKQSFKKEMHVQFDNDLKQPLASSVARLTKLLLAHFRAK